MLLAETIVPIIVIVVRSGDVTLVFQQDMGIKGVLHW